MPDTDAPTTPTDDEPVTLINIFEVPAEHVDTFVAQWRERAEIMAAAPGFRDSRLHRATSSDARFQLVNVAHWDSRADLAAAQANPAFQAHIQAQRENSPTRFTANPAEYQIAVTFEAETLT